MAAEFALPAIPAKHSQFLDYVQSHPDRPMVDLVKPYNEFDAVLRKIYAQQPSHSAVADDLVNVVPVFDDGDSADIRVRARDISSEPDEIKEKYLLPLKDEDRRPNGSPAVVTSFKEFQQNFNIFCESTLSDMDWSNVVAAGSAVATSLLPVPKEHANSKRGLRHFYHEKFAPASDVDLFLYGLTEEQAIEKIQQIETRIKDSILAETTTIRTKNVITIASQYPTRHVQIVLRIYKSIAEILTGFDVDCSCVAYNGNQVYMAPRGIGAYITQVNQIDLTRRSPSYENRLSKYSHRGFEVFWPQLDRSRIDPTVYERSFTRTMGLARLLVLEKLPKTADREEYLIKRRTERGRPVPSSYFRSARKLRGNIKNDWDDEVPDWLEEEDVSDYHTFTVPYGEKFHARKIEKLLYTKDLLLNAEWNKPKDRTVNLHRHPAFFGHFSDVIHDCCGYCPDTTTEEDNEIAEVEDKIYVKGDITFLKDNPGRQEIGSFNPITETDWTDMAYIANTEGLCQAIVDHDAEQVKEWLSQDDSDPNRRDYTGRTPLHLATITSTPNIVQCLVDHGARLISRLADGRTALHLAAARGDVDIIRILLNKSEENEEEESRKEHNLKKTGSNEINSDENNDSDDVDMISNFSTENHDADDTSYATGSFVNVKKDGTADVITDDKNELEPDIYDINILAWDNHTSPLHLAIINGHVAAVEELVSSFGADVLLPIKLLNDYHQSPRAAILTLVLALRLPIEKAKLMTAKLLQLGASPAQADLNHNTALHYFSAFKEYTDVVDIFLQHDQPSVQRAIDFISVTNYASRVISPLNIAIGQRNIIGALKLLEAGAKPEIKYEDFIKQAKIMTPHVQNLSPEANQKNFSSSVEQPIIIATQGQQPTVAIKLLTSGVNPNTLSLAGRRVLINDYRQGNGTSLLDCVQERLGHLRKYKGEVFERKPPLPLHPEDSMYLKDFTEGSYQMWVGSRDLRAERTKYKTEKAEYDRQLKVAAGRKGQQEKRDAVNALVVEYETLEAMLIEKGAKKFFELHPREKKHIQMPARSYNHRPAEPQPFRVSFTFNTPDLTETKKEGYIQLFEAAWNGDLDTIKAMTLDMWGPEKQFFPLEISVTDRNGFSPFSIAVLRGHIGIAEPIISIAKAQYKPQKDETEERFTLDTGDGETSDCYSDSDSGEDDTLNEIRLRRHIIDDRFTIENVGEIKTQVESRVPPLNVLNETCSSYAFIEEGKLRQEQPHGLIEYAICKDDPKLLKFLLEIGKELSAKSSQDTGHSIYSVPETSFLMAMRLCHLDCLKELIRCIGTGIPLDKLVEKSGVAKEKPIYYQGLSIHGEKRADWAAEGRGVVVSKPQDRHPPLLLAAYQGSLETVEWFLGTAPGRHYEEFAQNNKHEKRLEKLAQSAGGFAHSITNWLTSRRDLVLHYATMSKPTDASIRLVKYLVEQMPHCLSVKSVEGFTPLALAFYLHRVEFAKIMLQAGADQTARDKNGRNLLHLLFWRIPDSQKYIENLQKMLDLVDPLLISSMLLERSSLYPGSVTPFSQWMNSNWSVLTYRYNRVNEEPKDKLAIIQIILGFAQRTGQKHLEVLNGAGNSAVHDAVRFKIPKTLKLLLECRPDLLHLENATGSTPKELAENAWVREVTSDPPQLNVNNFANGQHGQFECVVCRPLETFIEGDSKAKGNKLPSQGVYELCRNWVCNEQTSKKRKLVTLFDANEVAKRLATQNTWGATQNMGRRGNNDTNEEIDGVMAWLNLSRLH